LVFPHNCNGCGGCSLVCPESAITEQFRDIGTIQEGCYRGVRLVQGLLNIGEARAPPVIRRVKQRAGPDEVCIIDAPPGSSCPVVEAMEGADYAIIVTESSSYALHDMAAIVSVIRKMGIPCGAVINKHVSGRDEVERYLEREGIPVLATIPLTREIAELCSNGGLLMDHGVRWNEVFSSIYAQVQERVSL
jgi:MinD superfamily P-loop ATPase